MNTTTQVQADPARLTFGVGEITHDVAGTDWVLPSPRLLHLARSVCIVSQHDTREGRVLAWLGELIDQARASAPALAGQTLGGAIAARFASRQAGRRADVAAAQD
jgi:hypothetical protein